MSTVFVTAGTMADRAGPQGPSAGIHATAPKNAAMEGTPPPDRLERHMQRQIQRKGLRPRFAATVIAAVWAVAVIVFGILERLVDPDTFDNVWLAMWWAMQTVTTVGYGDVVPQETAGKFIAAVLMLGGLALFAVVTGTITAAFVAQAQAYGRREDKDSVAAKLDEMDVKLDAIEAELGRLRGRAS